jgi:DNA repair protein RecN (Recombination protein N)
LVDIHGQHEHQSLSRPQAQRALLDAYADATHLARKVDEAWHAWQSVRKMRVAAEADAESIGREREQLEWQIAELENLAFSEEEWRAVSAEQTRLAHTASLVEAAEFAMQALSESETAALAAVSSVQSRLSALIEYDPGLREILDLVEPAQIQLQEAVYSLRHYQQRLDVDPQRLSEVDARLGAIHTAARKYRTTPESLSAVLERAKQRLHELDTNLDAKALERRESEQRAACEKVAGKLSSARGKAARKLSEKVTRSMQTLAMHGGAFEVALTSLDECASYGLEQVEFRVAGHAGTRPRALAKVASGGELSRISLAIETATSEVAQVPTLIFDEVDVGIGGGVAEIVGRMLSALGVRHQVMCVTHLAQVAASADQQWQVSKHIRDGSAISTVIRLEDQQRVEEIARMLGGVKITETTRKHAAELLHHSE